MRARHANGVRHPAYRIRYTGEAAADGAACRAWYGRSSCPGNAGHSSHVIADSSGKAHATVVPTWSVVLDSISLVEPPGHDGE